MEGAPGSEHNMCKGPVAGGSPAHSGSKVLMSGAGTAAEAWGNFLGASQGGKGQTRRASKSRVKNLAFFLRAIGNP